MRWFVKRIFLLFLFNSLFVMLSTAQLGNSSNTRRQLWGSIADGSLGTLTNVSDLRANYSKLLLSWRMLPNESYETAFDIFHQNASGWQKVNTEPIVNSTNYQVPDEYVNHTGDNTYRLCYHDSDVALDTYTISADQLSNKRPYISVFLKETASDPRISDVEEYIINDGGVADLDGDGQYEILLVRHAKGVPEVEEGEDQSEAEGVMPKSPSILEAYKLDGTFLWRVVFGPNITTGNSCVFITADYNGDGKDEVAIRTSEGGYFGDNGYIGDTNGDGRINYAEPGLYMRGAPEFISILDGMTGAELARAPHIDKGTSEEWGDNYFKRANSLRLAGAKLKAGNRWQIVACRGVYGKMVLEAWEYNGVGQEMTKLWRFDTDADDNAYKDYEGQGNHQLVVADVDGDGLDEITYGACAIDHDGKGLYTTKLGHGDMLHVGKFDPNRPGLQTYQCYESGLTRSSLRDAGTGEQIWALVGDQPGDEGRALIADIDPESPGYEAWVYDRIVYDINGNATDGVTASMVNFPIWWTGSLNRQLFDDRNINQYNREGGNNRVFSMYRYDVACANSTKNNVTFMGDILGDWREEIIIARKHPTAMSGSNRPIPGSTELMIFSTWHPTEHKFPYLMSDDVYYRAAIHQNVGYNSPNHLGYYFGSDMVKEPISPKQQVDKYWLGNVSLDWDHAKPNWIAGSGEAAMFVDGNSVMFGAQGNNDGEIVLAHDVAPAKVWFAHPNGKDYTVSGDGKLIGSMELFKLLDGTLTLRGNHTYTGQTTVDEGLFRIDGQLTSPVVVKERGNIGGSGTISSGITLAKGKTIAGAGIRPGFGNQEQDDLGILTLMGDLNLPGGNNLEFDVVPGTALLNDKLLVNGNFAADEINTIIVKFPHNQPVSGTYTLVTVSGSMQATAANFNLMGVEGRPFLLEVANGEIKLVIEEQREPSEVVWKGNVDNVWNHTTANFQLDGTAATFVFEDQVLFDNGGERKDVLLEEPVTTRGMRFHGGNYTFSGSGSIGGEGGITFAGSTNDSLFILLDKNTYTGTNIFSDGTVSVQHLSPSGTPSSLGIGAAETANISLSQASLHILQNSITDRDLTLAGTSTLDIDQGQTFIMNGDISGSGQFVKDGEGTLAIEGVSSFTGTTVIKDGTISFRSATSNQMGLGGGKITLEGGSLELYNSTSSDGYESIEWDIVVPEGKTGSLRTDGRSTLLGKLTGDGTLNVEIPFSRTDFKGDWSSFTGQININGGEFRVADGLGYGNATVNLESTLFHATGTNGRNRGMHIGALKGASSGILNGQSNANTVITIGYKNIDTEFHGAIGARAQLRKVGTGTQILTGPNTSTLATEIAGGRLLVNNDAAVSLGIGTGTVTVKSGAILGGTGSSGGTIVVEDGGALQPGNNGTGLFTAKSDVQLLEGAKMQVDINKENQEFDRLVVEGALAYGGTLVINLKGSLPLAVDDSFQLFHAAHATGSFAGFEPSSPGAGLLWDFNSNTGTLRVRSDSSTEPEQKTQEITFGALGNTTYDRESMTLIATSNAGLPIKFSSDNLEIARVEGQKLIFTGVGMAQIIAIQEGNEEWTSATVTQTITIGKGIQTIDFTPVPVIHANDDPYVLNATSNSGLPITYEVQDGSFATILDDRLSGLKAGRISVLARQVGNGLWAAAETSVEIEVLPARPKSQQIIFDAFTNQTYDQKGIDLAATTTSGLDIVYSSDNTAVTKVEGKKLMFTGVGSAVITASQQGNEEWAAATPISHAIVINKGIQEISFNTLPILILGDEPYLLIAESTSGLPVRFFLANATLASINDNKLVGSVAGKTQVIAEQEGNHLWTQAPAVAHELEILPKATEEVAAVTVAKVITPNGDGENDILVIHGIEQYSESVLQIFNRGGQVLFTQRDYNNIDKVFIGRDLAGNLLNNSTYFYQLEWVQDGKKMQQRGWFYLKR